MDWNLTEVDDQAEKEVAARGAFDQMWAALAEAGCDCDARATAHFCDHWPDHPPRITVVHQPECSARSVTSSHSVCRVTRN